MNQNYLQLLRSPDNGKALFYHPDKTCLWDEKKEYEYQLLEEKIPVLLPEGARKKSQQPEQHKKLDSQFYYVDHYQVDAEEFDYFEAYEDGATIHENRRLHETIIKEVTTATKKILDVGCGNAWVANHFCPKGVEVYSMDISTVNPLKALQKYPYENHFGLVADVFALPLKENSIDCIIASEIIEHVPNPKSFLQNLIKALKPGGKLIVTTPFNEKLAYSLCVHCNRPTPQHAHIHSFTGKKIRSLLQEEYRLKASTYTFSNKALTKLKTHIVLKYFPHALWRLTDRLANSVINKPARLLLKLLK